MTRAEKRTFESYKKKQHYTLKQKEREQYRELTGALEHLKEEITKLSESCRQQSADSTDHCSLSPDPCTLKRK